MALIRGFSPLALLLLALPGCAGGMPGADAPPPGVEQILPRGGIPAIFAPRFVSAAKADLPDDAWVLGVVVEGVAKAYSLNLLNRHEVVNDRSGGTAFAAVWWPLANTAVVYGREVNGRTLEFEPSGALLEASLVMRDRQTDSWWSIMTSDSIAGPLAGTALPELAVGEKTTWGAWRRAHPDTLVLSMKGSEHVRGNPYDGYFTSAETFRDIEAADDRLPPKEPVFAFRIDGRPWAIPHSAFAGGRVVDLPGDDRKLLLYRPAGASVYASSEAWLVEPTAAEPDAAAATLLTAARAGSAGFTRVEGFDTFWYTWVGVNAGTGLLP